MRIGLRSRRRVDRHRRTQVSEARHRDHAHAESCERPGEGHALVVAAAASVHHEQRKPCACLLVFDWTAARGQQHPARCCVRLGKRQVAVEPPADQRRRANQQALRDALAPFIAKARSTGRRASAAPRSRSASAPTGETAAVRAWAQRNGYEVGDRGRIPAEIRAAYTAAQG